jgi:long-chain acyl-CoA synthetase
MSYRSISEFLRDTVERNSDKVAYRRRNDDGSWSDVSWTEVGETVEAVSKSLLALDVGHADCVGILAQTRLEWVLCDFGSANIGAVIVGIYPSNLPSGCAYILNHCEAEVLFVENRAQLDKILEVRGDLKHLRHIVILDGSGDEAPGVMGWDAFLALGREVPDETVRSRSNAVQPDDLASLVYTSGTTGLPKGVMLTHRNLIFIAESSSASFPEIPNYETLLFLPLAHVFARLMLYSAMRTATPTAIAGDLTMVQQYFQEVRPHYVASVPRIYEKVYDKAVSTAAAAGGLRAKIFRWAVDVGRQVSRLKQAKKPIPAWLSIRYALADRLVLYKVRDALGGRLVFSFSGAAPLNPMIAEFFHACGITILEGIGMTENTSFTHVNRMESNKFGTVGLPGPGVEVKIAPDGEILFRGDGVMKGYYKDPEGTAEVLDAEGWLYSGDIGEIDEDGFLKITDRKKDLIITAGGKNIAPQRIERIMRTSHYIGQVMAHGDRRKYVTALITLEPEAIREWAVEKGLDSASLEELSRHPDVQELIRAEVEERNAQLASYETIKRFHILPRDFSIDAGELTPTLKIKRKVVRDKYGHHLEALYES